MAGLFQVQRGKKLRILFTSDLHGLDSAYERFATILAQPRFDLGVISGDLMTYPSAEEVRRAAPGGSGQSGDEASGTTVEHALRAKEKYYKSILRRSRKPILLLMGNDDGILGEGLEWTSEGNVVFINQKKARFGEYSFVGYQYTPPFVGGPFERPESRQLADLNKLQELCDQKTILVTHGPPRGVLDIARDGKHVGSKALAAMLRKKPVWLHLFGHVHGSFGKHGHFINGSYPLSRKYVVIDIDSREIELIQ
ncbi:MAG: metallophosphoesterase family protein [Spirochaetia bacterium]